jgi:tetratricopeptide (TPR) repeat protein
LVTPAGYERLREMSPKQYLEQQANAARPQQLWAQLKPLTPTLTEARLLMLVGGAEALGALAAIDQQRSVNLSGIDVDAANWFAVNARLAEGSGRLDEAVAHSSAAVVADPSNVDNLVAYALVLFKQSRLDRIGKVAQFVVLLAPQTTNAWMLAGIADAAESRHDNAVASFSYGIRLSKNPSFTKKYLLNEIAGGSADARVAGAVRQAVAANP